MPIPVLTIWKKISISKNELGSLSGQYQNSVTSSIISEFGDVNPDLDSITFEYCIIDLLRNWFKPELINSRQWKFDNDGKILSSGDNSFTGELPAYPEK
ncbi:MAG: hypothetical protein IPJ13_01495 [Saprospiraceae bacterium]|nr:hypothetical protein [Saprospiraceae bacterium]